VATLYLDRAQLELRVDGDALAMYESGKRRGTVPLGMVDRVVVQGRETKFESGVLIKLAEAGVATLFLSPRSHRGVALVLGPRHNDAAIRIAQALRTTEPDFCKDWARSMISSKLRRQHAFLLKCERDRADVRRELFAALERLVDVQMKLEQDASTIETLRGLEGAAARAYFKGLAAVFPPALGFHGRNRRPPRDPVNACLSLGYTMLHFDAVHAAHCAGLDPLIGFYHRPSFGRESLGCDLIEPMRPLVDRWVWDLFRERLLSTDHFSYQDHACLLGKTGRGHFFKGWARFAPVHRRWLRSQCSRLARALREDGMNWMEQDDGSIQ
jgi:CRISPR-associated protein Cas1